MTLSKTLLPTLAAATFVGATQAQVMTEVRVSTSGTDEEYIEILGTPGQSTDGLMLLAVEGDPGGATGANGTLDKAYDLAGFQFADEYWVVGSATAGANLAFSGEIDDTQFGDNMWENSSQTIYLVNVPDANLRSDILNNWLNTDITDPVGSTTTRLATNAGITILDAVAITDGDMGDVFYDSAPVFGPDGSFFPAGVFRPGGCPADWCSDEFLNFFVDGAPNPPYADPSPGLDNPLSMTCMTAPSTGVCMGGPMTIGTNYCMANANSTGSIGVQSALGSATVADNDVTLVASSLPNNSFGFFIASLDQGFVANPAGSQGNLCLAGAIGRYVGPGQIQNSGGNGEFQLAIDLTMVPQPTGLVSVSAGESWNFQTWFRDVVGGTATSNFTNGLEIDFN